MSESTKKTPDLIAYQVTETKDQSYWNRIGAAWKTKTGGYRIRLKRPSRGRRNRPAPAQERAVKPNPSRWPQRHRPLSQGERK